MQLDIVARLRAAGCVFAEDEARLLMSAAKTPGELDRLVDRRVGGTPLEHLLGWAEFSGLRFAVEPGVFVPRRRTELLVQMAARLARQPATVADLCCGCGAIGIALAAAVGGAELHAVDVDPVAVRCARRNVAALAPGAQVYEGDLYEPLPATLHGRVDLLVANVPYVPTDEIALMPPEARIHEPRVALDGGTDGLEVLRRVAADASAWLAPGGHLLIETSERQAPHAVEAFTAAGLVAGVRHDSEVAATVVSGRWALRP